MIWVAAALAASASLLRWASTDTQAHAWSVDAATALTAAAAQMTLAVLLVGRPAWTPRDAATVYLVGAIVSVAVVLAFVPTLVSAASTQAHGAHGDGVAGGIASIVALRLVIEVALICVLLWLYRRSRREASAPAA